MLITVLEESRIVVLKCINVGITDPFKGILAVPHLSLVVFIFVVEESVETGAALATGGASAGAASGT